MSGRVRRVAAPVREQVVEQLREAIETLELKPGQRLFERDLVEQMGASRPSIREALRRLESERLVVSVPNKGTFVATITRKEVREIYQVRTSLEGAAVRSFTDSAPDSQVHDLKNAGKAIREAIAGADPKALLRAKTDFYEVLLDGAGNQTAQEILVGLHIRISTLRATSLSRPGRPEQMVQEIEDIVAAVERRDAEAALHASTRHVVQSERSVLDALS